MSNKIEYYMQETLSLAEQALDQGELPIAALVVIDDKIISRAFALDKQEQRFLIHAELLALEKADKQLAPNPEIRRSATLFSTLEPCLMCMGAAMSFFVGHIYYGLGSSSDGATELVAQWYRKEEDLPEYQMPSVTGGVLKEESIRLFEQYILQNPAEPIWSDWVRTLIK